MADFKVPRTAQNVLLARWDNDAQLVRMSSTQSPAKNAPNTAVSASALTRLFWLVRRLFDLTLPGLHGMYLCVRGTNRFVFVRDVG